LTRGKKQRALGKKEKSTKGKRELRREMDRTVNVYKGRKARMGVESEIGSQKKPRKTVVWSEKVTPN